MLDSIALLSMHPSHPDGKLAGEYQIGSGIKDMLPKRQRLVWIMPVRDISAVDFTPSHPFRIYPQRM